jgi:hypothetical protein
MAGDWAGAVLAVLAVEASLIVVKVAFTARAAARRRGSWRAAFDRSRCEGCGEPSPIGLPRSLRDARRRLGGGWTCASCGLECDKWGAAVSGPSI